MTCKPGTSRRIAADISVAVATLDRPVELMRCIEAVLDGDVLPSQIVVVDQSRDYATRRALAALGETPVKISYVRQPKRGLAASRNLAAQVAKADILAVTDDDCVPDSGWVAAIERILVAPGATPDAVTGRVLPLGPPRPDLYPVSTRASEQSRTFRGKHHPWLVGTGGNLAVRRNWLMCVGGYDERLGAGSPGGAGEDTDLLYRLLAAGASICYAPEMLVFHSRQSRARRLLSRVGYGRGIGAGCAIWCKKGDPFAGRVLARWVFDHAWAFLGASRRGQWMRAYEELLMLRGTIQGLGYGLRAESQ